MSIGHFEYKFANIRSDKMSFEYLMNLLEGLNKGWCISVGPYVIPLDFDANFDFSFET